MKNILIFIVFMFAGTICYGQQDSEPWRYTEYTEWQKHPCYQGIQYRFRRYYYYKRKDGTFANGKKDFGIRFQFKNNYNQKVAFSFRFSKTNDGDNPTTQRRTLSPGEIYGNSTLQNHEGRIYVIIDKVCFNFKNGGDQDDCAAQPDVYKANYYYAACDNGMPNIKPYSGSKANDSNSNTQYNNTKENDGDEADPDAGLSIKEQYLKYREKRYSLCETIRKLDKQSRYSMDVRFPCNTQSTPIENPSRDDVEKYKREIAIIEKAIEELSVSNADVGQNNIEEERRQTEMQSKMDRYNSLMTQGSEAFASEDYSAAMTYYSQAKTTALTDEQRNYADEMYQKAFEAKKTAERAERVAHQKKVDDAENIGYVSAAASTITLMSLINDSPSLGFTSGKLLLGLNFGKLPLISNNVSAYHANKSYIEAPLMPGFDFGFNFGIANNKSVSLYLNPKFSYGLDAFSEGTSGYTMEYGGTALLRISFKKYGDEAGVKPYLEGGYFRRNGLYHYDGDAVNQSVGVSSSTDDVRDGDYKYTVIRYGGGLMYHWKDEDEEYMVRGGVFFDKPSFFPKDIKPVLGFNVQGMISYVGTLEFYFAPNYFVGGNLLYPATLEKKNKSYLGIKFTRAGKLW